LYFCHAATVLETVVVVDDDEAIREAMHDLLELEGFVVLMARDGQEALGVLAKAPRPCVAVIDLVMPRLDGWHVVSAIAGDPALRGIGIVCSTAGRAEPPPGCSAMLRKPFEGDALLAAIQLALTHARQALALAL
jgi:CheY-like chemotaxis protein